MYFPSDLLNFTPLLVDVSLWAQSVFFPLWLFILNITLHNDYNIAWITSLSILHTSHGLHSSSDSSVQQFSPVPFLNVFLITWPNLPIASTHNFLPSFCLSNLVRCPAHVSSLTDYPFAYPMKRVITFANYLQAQSNIVSNTAHIHSNSTSLILSTNFFRAPF